MAQASRRSTRTSRMKADPDFVYSPQEKKVIDQQIEQLLTHTPSLTDALSSPRLVSSSVKRTPPPVPSIAEQTRLMEVGEVNFKMNWNSWNYERVWRFKRGTSAKNTERALLPTSPRKRPLTGHKTARQVCTVKILRGWISRSSRQVFWLWLSHTTRLRKKCCSVSSRSWW